MKKVWSTKFFPLEAGLVPPSLAQWSSCGTGGIPEEWKFRQEGSLDTQAALLLPVLYEILLVVMKIPPCGFRSWTIRTEFCTFKQTSALGVMVYFLLIHFLSFLPKKHL